MSTTVENSKIAEAFAVKAWTEKRMVFVELHDGRIIGFPANRFKLLKKATEEELKEVKLRGNFALRWEKLDEDISVEGILAGRFHAETPHRDPAEGEFFIRLREPAGQSEGVAEPARLRPHLRRAESEEEDRRVA